MGAIPSTSIPATLIVPLESLQLPLDGAAVPPHGRGHGHHRELDLRRPLEALALVPGHGDGGGQRRGPVGHGLQLPRAVVTPVEIQ